METKDVYSYITTEENAWKITRVPLTTAKDWNMSEHIERCTNVSNAWFHSGKNDGLRPYNDIVTPIINVAFRSEGFDVKDIIPFVNDSVDFFKSKNSIHNGLEKMSWILSLMMLLRPLSFTIWY